MSARRAGPARLVAAAILALAALPTFAATVRLDDSASQVIPPNATWQWESRSLRSGINTLHMNIRVNVRIDTRAYAGRQGNIYMALPPDGSSTVRAEWFTHGRLLPGRLASGERVVVYSGVIPGPYLDDTIQVHLTTDARQLAEDVRRIQFNFELDTP